VGVLYRTPKLQSLWDLALRSLPGFNRDLTIFPLAQLTPGSLINVGVLYRTPKLQSLTDLARYLQSTPDAIRHPRERERESESESESVR